MILDTNAVSSLLSGDQQIGRVIANIELYYLPLPVVGEYEFGLLALGKRNRYKSLFRRLEAFSTILLPDRETANWYATIRHELKKRGTPIPEGDLWIAALARQHDLEILSRDEHFDVIEDVRRIGWPVC